MTSNDLSFITLVAEQNVQWLERAADRASKELKDMDGQTNVDLLQFNGRELFRESIECAESFVWAFKGKRPYPAAAAARMILDRQMTWAAIVGADNPCKALQEQALNSEKRQWNASSKELKQPANIGAPPLVMDTIQEEVDNISTRIRAATGKHPSDVKIGDDAAGTDEMKSMSGFLSRLVHANFTLGSVAYKPASDSHFWFVFATTTKNGFMELRQSCLAIMSEHE